MRANSIPLTLVGLAWVFWPPSGAAHDEGPHTFSTECVSVQVDEDDYRDGNLRFVITNNCGHEVFVSWCWETNNGGSVCEDTGIWEGLRLGETITDRVFARPSSPYWMAACRIHTDFYRRERALTIETARLKWAYKDDVSAAAGFCGLFHVRQAGSRRPERVGDYIFMGAASHQQRCRPERAELQCPVGVRSGEAVQSSAGR